MNPKQLASQIVGQMHVLSSHDSTLKMSSSKPAHFPLANENPRKCFYCGKLGHIKRFCRQRTRDLNNSQQHWRDQNRPQVEGQNPNRQGLNTNAKPFIPSGITNYCSEHGRSPSHERGRWPSGHNSPHFQKDYSYRNMPYNERRSPSPYMTRKVHFSANSLSTSDSPETANHVMSEYDAEYEHRVQVLKSELN